jgi:hypothetical protein
MIPESPPAGNVPLQATSFGRIGIAYCRVSHIEAQTGISCPNPHQISAMTIDWKKYDPGECYDGLISSPGHVRAVARNLTSWLRGSRKRNCRPAS